MGLGLWSPLWIGLGAALAMMTLVWVPGDALDFWRVEAIEPDSLLRLAAEMRLPGRASLQFEVEPHGEGSLVRQMAVFDPRGLLGLAYWYALYPRGEGGHDHRRGKGRVRERTLAVSQVRGMCSLALFWLPGFSNARDHRQLR